MTAQLPPTSKTEIPSELSPPAEADAYSPPPLFGVMVEYVEPAQVLHAARQAMLAGYREMDAYTPYPVEGLAQELGQTTSRIPFIVLVGGLVGAGVGFLMQYWSMAVDYRFNSGGRPYNSWPVFIPITFEVLILVASLSAFLGMLFLNGLPRPHHPVFNVPSFVRASRDRFFLCIEATDPKFDPLATAEFLSGIGPHVAVIEVPFQNEPLVPSAESEVSEPVTV